MSRERETAKKDHPTPPPAGVVPQNPQETANCEDGKEDQPKPRKPAYTAHHNSKVEPRSAFGWTLPHRDDGEDSRDYVERTLEAWQKRWQDVGDEEIPSIEMEGLHEDALAEAFKSAAAEAIPSHEVLMASLGLPPHLAQPQARTAVRIAQERMEAIRRVAAAYSLPPQDVLRTVEAMLDRQRIELAEIIKQKDAADRILQGIGAIEGAPMVFWACPNGCKAGVSWRGLQPESKVPVDAVCLKCGYTRSQQLADWRQPPQPEHEFHREHQNTWEKPTDLRAVSCAACEAVFERPTGATRCPNCKTDILVTDSYATRVVGKNDGGDVPPAAATCRDMPPPVYPPPGQLRCPTCGEDFPDPETLEGMTVRPGDQIRCPTCQQMRPQRQYIRPAAAAPAVESSEPTLSDGLAKLINDKILNSEEGEDPK